MGVTCIPAESICCDFHDIHARFGDSALQYSLMTLTAVTCTWASLHLFLASRTITADLQRNGAASLRP
jgi:hypothetical protein